ncbi:MAG: hypothetical protein ACNS62_24765 [Candidatus Cyclobacteriaceae bacterium M3_2C_046]
MSDKSKKYLRLNVRRNIVLLTLLLLFSNLSWGQNIHISPTFGFNYSNYWGDIMVIDSINLEIQEGTENNPIIGVLLEYNLNKIISLNSSLNYFANYSSYLIYNNQENCKFCPVIKARSIAHPTVELNLTPAITIPIFKSLLFKGFIGASLNLQFSRNEPNYFDNRHPGVSEVVNNLDNIINPLSINLAYGFLFEYKKFMFIVRFQSNRGNSFTEKIEIFNNSYKSNFKASYLSFSLGYRLLEFD